VTQIPSHDFHDNLYVLLRGRKRFVLYPPSAYPYLHLRGNVERLHSNGLISYTPSTDPAFASMSSPGNSGLRADGLDPLDAARWRVKNLDRRIEFLRAQPDGTKELKRVQRRYEEAMDEMMELQLAGMPDDDVENQSDGRILDDGDEEGSDDEEDRPLFGSPDMQGSDFDEDVNMSDDAEDILERLGEASANWDDKEPPSFSRISVASLHRHLGSISSTLDVKAFRKSGKKTGKSKSTLGPPADELSPLDGCPPALLVNLEPGDMLYLPTSWFHEVTSSSDENGSTHIAFN
jgi:hypothetical protein